MRFQRIQFPGKTLVVSSLDQRYNIFPLFFLNLWADKFGEYPDFSLQGHTAAADVKALMGFSSPVQLPQTFWRQLWFLLQRSYGTIVFLNPDPKADRKLKWAARLAFVKRRAGFAPLRHFQPLNFSLPFNSENHHYIHQLKLFFEYLIGEKVHHWNKPQVYVSDLAESGVDLPDGDYGLLAIDTGDQAAEPLLGQLMKFVNLATRSQSCVLLIQSHTESPNQRQLAAQNISRRFSEIMTEQALGKTTLVINPDMRQKIRILRDASWATGVDAEILNLAALMEIPNLGVFGPLNERIWQPFATRARVLTGEFACRPCTRFPGAVLCTNPVSWQCVSAVSSELMAATLAGMMRRKAKQIP